MGFNGTFWFVEHGRPDEVATALEAVLAARGMPIVSRAALTVEPWHLDRCQLGFALRALDGWIAIATSDRTVDVEIASALAASLVTPVVISSIYEICDPPEPEIVQVFGGDPHDLRFRGLYWLGTADYGSMIACDDATRFVVRTPEPREHVEDWRAEPASADDDDDDDIAF